MHTGGVVEYAKAVTPVSLPASVREYAPMPAPTWLLAAPAIMRATPRRKPEAAAVVGTGRVSVPGVREGNAAPSCTDTLGA